MPRTFDLFSIKSTSEEAHETRIVVGDLDCSLLEWQAIVGRLYAKASRFRSKTNKHEVWRKAAEVRAKVNAAYEEQHGKEDDIDAS
jgi:hypothetical protein